MVSTSPAEEPTRVQVHWTDSEWFEVWLRLAKRDYQGDASADNQAPSWIAQAAVA